MDDALGVKSLITVESEGLTEEDLQQAEQALKVNDNDNNNNLPIHIILDEIIYGTWEVW
jgi:hypothetical protein